MARASAFQAEGRGFESRFPLQEKIGDLSSAHVAQSVEHILGKDEVTSSILVVGSIPFLGVIMRNIITLACTECKQKNYTTTKNKRTMQNRLEIKKFCKFCRGHKVHRETK